MSCEHVLVDLVDADDIAKALGDGTLADVVEAVSRHRAPFVADDGALQQMGVVCTRVVGATFAVDVIVAVVDVGGSHDARRCCAGVVVEGVADEGEAGILQIHIVVEDGLARGRAVLSPFARERVLLVHEFAALEEVTEVIESVIVEAVTEQAAVVVLEHHIVARHRQLVEAVVVEDVGVEDERVGLVHHDMAEGIEGVASLIVEGAVAGEDDVIVAEADVAHKNLCLAMHTLVVVEFIRMNQVDARAFRTRSRPTPDTGTHSSPTRD